MMEELLTRLTGRENLQSTEEKQRAFQYADEPACEKLLASHGSSAVEVLKFEK
jgi:hypothetical protein